jgi:hypothetical protein
MFKIQISNPATIKDRNRDDGNIVAAIQSIFPLVNEYCFIIWDHIFIPLSYKYDISIMIKDILRIINFIKKEEKCLEIHWASNTFFSLWKMEFTSHSVIIESTWKTVLGDLTELLKKKTVLEVDKQVFLNEWKTLALFVKNKLEEAGYNSTNLEDFDELENMMMR